MAFPFSLALPLSKRGRQLVDEILITISRRRRLASRALVSTLAGLGFTPRIPNRLDFGRARENRIFIN